MSNEELKQILDDRVALYNQPAFIVNDPISIPHRFSRKHDIEISGFFSATFAWGQRKTAINKAMELMQLMDHAPHDYILNHRPSDLKKLQAFKHRTFNSTDTLCFVAALQNLYRQRGSLEPFFEPEPTELDLGPALQRFAQSFFALADLPQRTRKHVADPARGSTCKRLNMFLRWMVRQDENGVDFGIWKKISPSQLICPIDVHVGRVARDLGLIRRKQTDWQTAAELTQRLRDLDADDPVKYDFALFGMGVIEGRVVH